MNRNEIIFLIGAVAIMLICIATIPQYSFLFIFLLALALIVIIMSIFSKYSKKYENKKLSVIFCILGIILFILYFINSAYIDLTNKGTMADNVILLALFVISICLGWFFE
ncbi:MAG: hypothetical protein IJF83_01795 [Methanobrevibacter sp.]|nr:hypothetical protein [Methanobrevibacter sp.]